MKRGRLALVLVLLAAASLLGAVALMQERLGAQVADGAASPAESRRALPASAPPPARSHAPVASTAPRACAGEMVLVDGDYCTKVEHDCEKWLDDPKLPFARCAVYKKPARCTGERVRLRFCIDRYEYTADGHSRPLNHQSFVLGSKLCRSLGKRLCSESEWNFACEGEKMRPYPYGWSREAVCNQDQSDLYAMERGRQVLRDLREPATARLGCVSPFGVYNMAGNLDEPVRREDRGARHPFRNALKGGWWMAARNRCRPATTAHDDYYKDMQVGVRCCSDAPEPNGGAAARQPQ